MLSVGPTFRFYAIAILLSEVRRHVKVSIPVSGDVWIPIFDSLGLGLGLEASGLGLGLGLEACGLGVGLEGSGLGLDVSGLGLKKH